ncbi:hypothetical protein PFY12_14425 [Chryseobacterium camelliae]|uniref:Uncharacterized protein n=1 Tax=Chryseobacterium camelliae TaxID=1265445 RepID=A0ABY7QKR9_9FLAO|nr:hypothetical protein [Chryseobacterium camelliae]WBV60220.1 hypothetical protein PFY12_14425 [Chryseobacterium camelliae]
MAETYYEKVYAERDEYFEEQDVLGSLEYSVNNILEIIQQGGDRDLFEQLKTKLSEVEI